MRKLQIRHHTTEITDHMSLIHNITLNSYSDANEIADTIVKLSR